MTDFSSSPFGNTITSTDVLTLLTAQAGWQNKYRQLIQLGNKIPALSDDYKIAENQIKGCESQAWLALHCDNDERLWFGLDSDARIVKGLMATLLAAVNGKTRAEIAAFDVDDYFAQLGFMQQLSPSRGNGLKAVIAAIKAA
ncbi:cysteine desulfurase sulfur acceptor subunit CsdE [Moritella sp. F3]|uniref:cysteine desulfurase sulfur acceptor subunit CsdE n=1 Tax=Moritella sp. F3 TaxID=2718882 RepID=UPI0018E16CAF|nr:cysteine desulfurase sulfur acceptor subunit CsdE [Moritella sp. F3]GIC78430.1 cysteine desulfurase, sulfur acceptor subunit CsdE [Moritella sp. F1]GIC83930.1 cysteine desulfurase, sulfur acceptor subunit CsdE [Moritella sp. F3]